MDGELILPLYGASAFDALQRRLGPEGNCELLPVCPRLRITRLSERCGLAIIRSLGTRNGIDGHSKGN